MKKIILAACLAATGILFSCSREEIQRLPGSSHNAKNGNNANNKKTIVNSTVENSTYRFGGEDDDKPIIMHLVESNFGPLQNARIIMVSGTDSLESFTNSAGESFVELPHLGSWDLTITYEEYSPLNVPILVTDSFSVKKSSLDY